MISADCIPGIFRKADHRRATTLNFEREPQIARRYLGEVGQAKTAGFRDSQPGIRQQHQKGAIAIRAKLLPATAEGLMQTIPGPLQNFFNIVICRQDLIVGEGAFIVTYEGV